MATQTALARRRDQPSERVAQVIPPTCGPDECYNFKKITCCRFAADAAAGNN